MTTISIADYKKLAKEGRVGNAKKGDKAKAEMYSTITRLFGYCADTEFRFSKRRFKFDFAIPHRKIAVEYEGLMSEKSGHTTVKGYTSNCRKYNLAALHGWKVLRYTALNYKQLENDLKQLL